MLTLEDLRELEAIVRKAAAEELLSRFRQVEARSKADGSLITEADLEMQARVLRELRQRWPQFELLGEEMDAGQQMALLQGPGKGLWILDPLDGTANFASGIAFFGVSLALMAGGRVQAGVVYDPVRDESFSALRGQGAWLNGSRLSLADGPDTLKQAMAMVDFKRLPASLVTKLASAAPYRSQRSFGSVALDWCWLAAGRVQVYLHGGQKLWDYAAGSLVLQESGGQGGLFEDYVGTAQTELTLLPRIAVAATGDKLFALWDAWLRNAAQSG